MIIQQSRHKCKWETGRDEASDSGDPKIRSLCPKKHKNQKTKWRKGNGMRSNSSPNNNKLYPLDRSLGLRLRWEVSKTSTPERPKSWFFRERAKGGTGHRSTKPTWPDPVTSSPDESLALPRHLTAKAPSVTPHRNKSLGYRPETVTASLFGVSLMWADTLSALRPLLGSSWAELGWIEFMRINFDVCTSIMMILIRKRKRCVELFP